MNKKKERKTSLIKGQGWHCLEVAASEDGAFVDRRQLVVITIAGLTTFPMPVHAMALRVVTVDRHFLPAMVAETKHHSLKVLDNPSSKDAVVRWHAVGVQLVGHVKLPSHCVRCPQRAYEMLPEAVAVAACPKAFVEGCSDAFNIAEAFMSSELVSACAHHHTGIALERGVREGCDVAHEIALFAASLAIRDARESFHH